METCNNKMKLDSNKIKIIICLFVLILELVFLQIANAQKSKNQPKADNSLKRNIALPADNKPEKFVSIDFNDVDINVFIKFISELTGKNFVVDHKVKGKVTIISPAKITVNEAYKVFESVLEVHGYATVRAGEIIKIIPSPDARTKNIETRLKEESSNPEDKVITQLIRLKYADPTEIKRLFAPLISKSSVLLAYNPTRMLILTDVYSNVTRLLKILKTIDIAGIGYEISVIPLEFATAEKLVKIIDAVFSASKQPKRKQIGQQIKMVSDNRTNTIILMANEDKTLKVKKLIKLLDKETPRGKETIHVYYLENAVAEELAEVLQKLPSKKGGGAKGIKAPIVSDQVRITADKATNSLIIMAGKDDYLVIEEIMKKLDIPRSMVFIECLIMEVNVEKDFNLGAEWIAMGETSYRDRNGGYGGGFSGGGDQGFRNILGVTAPGASGAGTLPAGFSLGIFSEALQIGSVVFPNLAAMIHAYKKDKDVHILSTPQILTTDNEEATITVGKNIPYLTKSGSSDVESYNTYEYKDVGISLTITPHISKDRQVRLKISQEVTKLDELAGTGENRPTTLKRTIDTTVIARDKSTIVIGGLIDNSLSSTEYATPCLSSVPGLGNLFKSLSRSGEKTNLFVFLTPHVISNPEEAKEVYNKKNDQIKTLQEGNIKMYDQNSQNNKKNQP